MINVEECVKLEERKSLVEIFFPSLQIDTMDHLPYQLLAPGRSTLRKKCINKTNPTHLNSPWDRWRSRRQTGVFPWPCIQEEASLWLVASSSRPSWGEPSRQRSPCTPSWSPHCPQAQRIQSLPYWQSESESQRSFLLKQRHIKNETQRCHWWGVFDEIHSRDWCRHRSNECSMAHRLPSRQVITISQNSNSTEIIILNHFFEIIN